MCGGLEKMYSMYHLLNVDILESPLLTWNVVLYFTTDGTITIVTVLLNAGSNNFPYQQRTRPGM